MNTKYLLITALIAAFGFTACNNDDEDNNLRKEVKITTSINRSSDALSTKAVIDPATGAGNLENGDQISLRVLDSAIGLGFDYTIGVTNLYWDDLLDDLTPPFDFIAFYPRINLVNVSQQGFNVATAANPDLLSAYTPSLSPGDFVDLTFNHIMHQLRVNLSSDLYNESELAAATVSLKNLKSHAIVEVNDGTTNYTPFGDDPYPSQTGANTTFIVAPQDLTQGADWIEISLAGKRYTYQVPATLKPGDNPSNPRRLESGKVLSLSLKLTTSDVSGTIGDDFTGGGGYTGW